MFAKIRSVGPTTLAALIFIALSTLGFVLLHELWRALVAVNANLAVGIVTAVATIIAATVTVMLGRYYERKREIEAHFRAEKIKIYDEFLKELFKVFHSDGKSPDGKLTAFLREWQRKIVLWSGGNVLGAYFKWSSQLKNAQAPDAQTIFLMDEFFRALRADIGQSSRGLPRGAFANLILRHGDFFLEQAAKNPRITLTELAEREKERFG